MKKGPDGICNVDEIVQSIISSMKIISYPFHIAIYSEMWMVCSQRLVTGNEFHFAVTGIVKTVPSFKGDLGWVSQRVVHVDKHGNKVSYG